MALDITIELLTDSPSVEELVTMVKLFLGDLASKNTITSLSLCRDKEEQSILITLPGTYSDPRSLPIGFQKTFGTKREFFIRTHQERMDEKPLRMIEVYLDTDSRVITVTTRQQDSFTNAIAKAIADLARYFWGKD